LFNPWLALPLITFNYYPDRLFALIVRRKCGTLVQMQLKPVLDLILLQLLDHFLKEPGFTELAFDPMSNSSRLLQSPPEVDLFIPKI
jgi:hypothetical protein